VKIETEDTGRSIVRSLVFSDVKVYVSGVFNLLGMQSAHRLRRNSSALSALCSELTQGRLPYFISDYNNTSTGVFLPTRLVDVFTTDYGHVVQVSNERTFTNVFSDFICSDQGSTY
jgi:citrate lyase alpha subunit